MKAQLLIIVIMVLGLAGPSEATIVELDLLSLGCPTEFSHDSPLWQKDFDLGVKFIEITNVYMDWSGGITAGLAIDYDYPNEPFPLDVAISAYLDMPIDAGTSVWGERQLILIQSRLTANQILNYLDWGHGLVY